MTQKEFVFRYESAAHMFDVFERFYGPTYKAFGSLEPEVKSRLLAELVELASRYNRRKSSLVLPAEYLEVVIER